MVVMMTEDSNEDRNHLPFRFRIFELAENFLFESDTMSVISFYAQETNRISVGGAELSAPCFR